VPRNACVFSRVKLAARSNNAARALVYQVKHAQPFENATVRIVPDKGDKLDAGAWAWGSEQFDGKDNDTRLVVPEALVRTPARNGARLVKCHDGVDGEVWKGGSLIGSRWWRNNPSQNEWRLFLRACQTSAGAVPESIDPVWRTDIPRTAFTRETVNAYFSPMRLALTVAGISIFFLSFYSAQLGYLTYRTNHASQSMQTILDTERALFDARAGALSANAQIDLMQSIGRTWTVLEALAVVSDEFSGQPALLRNFRFDNGDCEFEINPSETLDVPQIVERLEKFPLFEDVFVETLASGSLKISARMSAVNLQWLSAAQQ